MYSDHFGLEPLSPGECVDLLRTRSLGRVGLSAGSLPYVLPVRYVVDGERILMRTGLDTRMAAATKDAVVAFQVDAFDDDLDAGWSVLVQGRARDVSGSSPVEPAAEQVLSSWVGRSPARCFAIPLELVKGQRMGEPGGSAGWGRSSTPGA
jgi:nitroimidazol reductase NimA-like FMN-containing flavoprotein (pyridoxamine 5'-phosphate oxidase superfamily)